MRLTVLGGGGFRVPLVYGALLGNPCGITEVVLHDVDPGRLAVIAAVLAGQADGHPGAPAVRTSTDLDTALDGADFVFCAVRVGGLDGRTADERVALDLGVLGQETTGPGGIAYGLRTVPVALDIAERVAARCPRAWVINFTNPAGMITEAMRRVLGERVIGICDSPVGLARRAARAAGADPDTVRADYVGLNHLGWLCGLDAGERDLLGPLLADDAALAGFEEGALFGAPWLRAVGALPNEYLYYYYFTREAITAIAGGPATRGEFLLRQQSAFYAAAAAEPDTALARWERTRHDRDASYLAEARSGARDDEDIAAGGYERVALAVLTALSGGTAPVLPLNVGNSTGNGAILPALPADAVVEVTCTVTADGPRPLPTRGLGGHKLGLVSAVKEAERRTIAAATSRSPAEAVAAFAVHPLVDSVATARLLFDGYRSRLPGIAALFG